MRDANIDRDAYRYDPDEDDSTGTLLLWACVFILCWVGVILLTVWAL